MRPVATSSGKTIKIARVIERPERTERFFNRLNLGKAARCPVNKHSRFFGYLFQNMRQHPYHDRVRHKIGLLIDDLIYFTAELGIFLGCGAQFPADIDMD